MTKRRPVKTINDTVVIASVPGPDHQARWMADCIYYQKILSCSNKFHLSEEELRQAENIPEFIVILYSKPWFQCTLASEAALSDLTFLCIPFTGVFSQWNLRKCRLI